MQSGDVNLYGEETGTGYPIVFVHEFGHYIVAKWAGVKIDTFSLGFGKEIVGWNDKSGTRWKISNLPLGGYVKFAGDMSAAGRSDPDWLMLPAEERAKTFQAKAVWQRALIVLAGPMTNFLVAVTILAGFALTYGELTTPARVMKVEPNSACPAVAPRVTTTRGFRSPNSASSQGRHADTWVRPGFWWMRRLPPLGAGFQRKCFTALVT